MAAEAERGLGGSPSLGGPSQRSGSISEAREFCRPFHAVSASPAPPAAHARKLSLAPRAPTEQATHGRERREPSLKGPQLHSQSASLAGYPVSGRQQL